MHSKTKKIYYVVLAFAALAIKLTTTDSNVCQPEVAIYFTPGSPATQKIVNRINEAKKEILVQSYSFTSPDIADALIEAHKRGVQVICIFDYSQKSKIMILKVAQSGIPTYIDHPLGIAHNKVMIIDDVIVLTGSFNFTNAAQHRNVENSIHIVNAKIAAEYKQQWSARLELSKKLDPI